MFYFDTYNGQKVLRSSLLEGLNAFFTLKQEKPFDFGRKRIIAPVQTHSDNVSIIDDKTNEYPNTDGLICKSKNVTYYLKFADCTPIIFYDPVNKISAIAHAGWRGTASKIGVKTFNIMHEKFGSDAKDVIAVIGTSISVCCYEVSDDVKNALCSTIKNNKDCYKNNHVDLKIINQRQLYEAGITKIDISPYCTSCNNELFYSYRKENKTTMRHYAVVVQ